MIYTSNIHCNYAHSFMTQWLYFYSEKENAREAYSDIKDLVLYCGAQESVQRVIAVYDESK